MEGADVVLGLGQVHPGLAAIGRVDLGHQRGRHLGEADPALVGGRAEPGQVADHAAAERDDDVLARHPAPGQLGPHDLGVRDGLRLLAGHDRHAAAQRLEVLAVPPTGVPVGDQEPAAGDRRRPEALLGQQAVPDVGRIVGRLVRRPQQLGVLGDAFERFDDGAHAVRALRWDDRIGQGRVHRLAPVVESLELGALAGQRSIALAAARPGQLEGNIEPDGQMVPQGRADSFVADRASAEGQHSGLRVVEQLERDLLLGGAERGLAVLGEHPLDRLAQPLLDHPVDVHRGPAEGLGQAARGGRLAGAHEADAGHAALGEPVVVDQGRRHWIRSS